MNYCRYSIVRFNGLEIAKMIIIKIDQERNEETNMTIATTLFNMELGKKVFNIDGSINNPDEDLYILTKDGISYTIHGIVGNIVVIYRGENHRYTEFLISDIEKILHDLDMKYMDEFKEINCYNGKSMDYTLVSEAISDRNKKRRKIVKNKDTPPNKGQFLWRIDWPEIFMSNSRKYVGNRNLWEYETLLLYNTLVIDTDNVFNTKENITIIDDIPKVKDYNISTRFVSLEEFTYDKKYGRIDSILREMKDPGYNDQHTMYITPVFVPIYEEKWENIKPIRVYIEREECLIDNIIKLLTSSYDYTLMELEEVKNVESGAPPAPNDICHSCRMYLYDTIYVLECQNNHVCVCARCFHNDLYPELFDINNNITVLKVKYPKTVFDIIYQMDMPSEIRQLMIELSGEDVRVDMKELTITTPNFVGYSEIDSILLKTRHPPEGKRLFICKILS